jgi:hypothetical protein
MIQPVTREAVTTETVLVLGIDHLLAVLGSPCVAGFRFEPVVTSALREESYLHV